MQQSSRWRTILILMITHILTYSIPNMHEWADDAPSLNECTFRRHYCIISAFCLQVILEDNDICATAIATCHTKMCFHCQCLSLWFCVIKKSHSLSHVWVHLDAHKYGNAVNVRKAIASTSMQAGLFGATKCTKHYKTGTSMLLSLPLLALEEDRALKMIGKCHSDLHLN